MTDIWAFILQTLTISAVAALLLLVKWLLCGKFSPRWQYAVWGILALRIALPVVNGRNILLPLPLWVETIKGITESSLSSSYSSTYLPIKLNLPIPWISGSPKSVTDWIFIIYTVGVVVVLLLYLFSYIRLRLKLSHSEPITEDMRTQIDSLCEKHSLKSCKAVTVEGLSSPLVCGVINPILAMPAKTEIDKKVLLHELLHVKYYDTAQNIIWSIFRALNWCNPFLNYVFNHINNDMEVLCDYRVMKRLEDEQRQEYGTILMSMMNKSCRCAPGTTSLSNSDKNIARRIASVSKFKKYSPNMVLVSVCICIVLLSSSLIGLSSQIIKTDTEGESKDWNFAKAMASARITRCHTIAGALDTYAKGLMYENGIYIATASPLLVHETLAEKIKNNTNDKGRPYYHLENGKENIRQNGYWVYNLKKLARDSYEAMLIFVSSELITDYDENGNLCTAALVYPVKVSYEDAWVVTRNGEEKVFPNISQFDIQYGSSYLPCHTEYKASGKSGTATTQVQSIYTVDNTMDRDGLDLFLDYTSFDKAAKPNTEFNSCTQCSYTEYSISRNDNKSKGLKTIGMVVMEMEDKSSLPEFSDECPSGNGSGSCNDGSSWASKIILDDWDGTIMNAGGGTYTDEGSELVLFPEAYAVRIFWNGDLKETMVLKEIDNCEKAEPN